MGGLQCCFTKFKSWTFIPSKIPTSTPDADPVDHMHQNSHSPKPAHGTSIFKIKQKTQKLWSWKKKKPRSESTLDRAPHFVSTSPAVGSIINSNATTFRFRTLVKYGSGLFFFSNITECFFFKAGWTRSQFCGQRSRVYSIEIYTYLNFDKGYRYMLHCVSDLCLTGTGKTSYALTQGWGDSGGVQLSR